MKFLISFRYTGADLVQLEKDLNIIRKALENKGHEVLCTFWDEDHFQEQKFTSKQILDFCCDKLDQADGLFVFLNSSEKSEGMLLEIGYALAKKKTIILGVQKDIKTGFLREVADKVLEFKGLDDLVSQLEIKELNLEKYEFFSIIKGK